MMDGKQRWCWRGGPGGMLIVQAEKERKVSLS